MGRPELRAVGSVSVAGRRLSGLALPYNRPAKIAGRFTETIAPGAMVVEGDCLLLAHHDPAQVLARTSNGSLRLDTRGAEGVTFEADLPDTTLARDILTLIEARTLTGCSAGFMVEADEWRGKERLIRRGRLAEISIVASPCFEATHVAARSEHMALPLRLRLARRYLEIAG